MVRTTALLVACELAAYLVGGIPFGYLIARAKAGIDIREHGSGNIGATNVGRVLGLRFFFLVFLLDFLKGAVPVAIALFVRHHHGDTTIGETYPFTFLPELVGVAAILGHVFPIYLHLRGGKGVATSIGVILLLAPTAGLIGLAAWFALVILSRMISVGSIGFATAFAFAYLFTTDGPFRQAQLGLTFFVFTVSLLVVVRHWSNIGNIVNGTEPAMTMPWERDSQG